MALTYSSGLFDLCHKHDVRATMLSLHAGSDVAEDELLQIANLGMPQPGSGWRYYTALLAQTSRVMRIALAERPDLLVISDRVVFWPALALLRPFGMRVVNVMHVGFWSDVRAPRRLQRSILAAERWFLRHHSLGVLGVSEGIVSQVRELCGEKVPAAAYFRPQWDRKAFDAIPLPPVSRSPFRLLFAGRVEVNKGILDLVCAMQSLRESGHAVILHICGEGSATGQLRQAIADAGLEDTITLHGHCTGNALRRLLGKSHAVVVPTRSDFVEGFNKVLVEAVLARRPVVTSRVCPAISAVGDAALEAEPDDWLSYAKLIERLIVDRRFYNAKVAAATEARECFFDDDLSLAARLEDNLFNQRFLSRDNRALVRALAYA